MCQWEGENRVGKKTRLVMASAAGKPVEESDFCGRHHRLAEGTVLRIGVVPSLDLSLRNVSRGLLESMRP